MSDVVVIEEEGAAAPAVPVLREDDAPKLPEAAELQDDGSVILPLRFPVTLKYRRPHSDEVREELITQVHMHRLTGADMRAVTAAKDGARAEVLLARSARILEGKFKLVFERMDGADIAAASQVAEYFLGPGPKAGR